MKKSNLYNWPEPYKAAFVFTIDVDVFTPLAWRTNQQYKNNYAEYEQRMFGITQGIPRIIQLLKEKQIPATFFVPSLVAEKHPGLLPEIIKNGFEIGLHGHCHEDFTQLSDKQTEEIIEKGISIFSEQVGNIALGFRAPYFKMRKNLIANLIKHKIAYDSSLMRFDHPYSIEDFVEIPVDWTFDDALYWLFAGNPSDTLPPVNPIQALENWKANTLSLIKTSSLINFTIHPWVSGRSYNLEKVATLIDFVKDQKTLWLTSTMQLARFHKNSANFENFKQGMNE